ncbi:MAG: glycosyltransferase family 2 protein [Candidatus Omnitrophota bacterium]
MIKPRALTSLSMVFPCYNESLNLGNVIEQALKVGEMYGVDYEIVVADDGSEDNSAEIVRQWSSRNSRIKLVQHGKNRGYGAAVRTAIGSATKDLVLLADSDNQQRLENIEKLFSKIDSCDAVVGYRIRRQDNTWRRMGGSFWTLLSNFLFRLKIRDVDCAFKLFRRKALEGVELKSDNLLIHAEILARLRKKGCRIEEIGIPHYPREAGKATATRFDRVLKSIAELFKLYWQLR